jgi:hypothetical protein
MFGIWFEYQNKEKHMKRKGITYKTLKTILRFGKYRDSTIAEILELDPTYIEWCTENINDFVLDKEAQEELYDCLDTGDPFQYIDEHETICGDK